VEKPVTLKVQAETALATIRDLKIASTACCSGRA
jgi:hypothetical protein